MSHRVTEKMLESCATRINVATGNPVDTFTKRKVNGSYQWRIGNFCLSHAYGGVALHQVSSKGGACRDVFRCGHVSKRQLWDLMQAYLTAHDDLRYGNAKRKRKG